MKRKSLIKNEYSLFVSVKDLDLDAFLHCNDLTYLNNGEEELKKYNINDKIKVKVLEIKTDEQKIRVGLRQTNQIHLIGLKIKKLIKLLQLKLFLQKTKDLLLDLKDVKWTSLLRKVKLQ